MSHVMASAGFEIKQRRIGRGKQKECWLIFLYIVQCLWLKFMKYFERKTGKWVVANWMSYWFLYLLGKRVSQPEIKKNIEIRKVLIFSFKSSIENNSMSVKKQNMRLIIPQEMTKENIKSNCSNQLKAQTNFDLLPYFKRLSSLENGNL